MNGILNLLAIPLGFLMRISYSVVANYGWAVLLFTVLTRIVILPVSIWLHKYSIRLVKMTPDLLRVQATYFGDKDRIAEEQAKLYKKNKYNPLVTLIPLAIQIVLLMGVIQVVNHPLDYVLQIDSQLIPAINSVAIDAFGLTPEDSSVQLAAVSLIQAGTHAEAFAALGVDAAVLEQIALFNTRFFGIDITLIPSIEGGLTILAPVVAALAAFLLCIVQNKANVLQAEQGMANQITTMLISVGLSAYLGYFVPMGVAIYWVAGNLVAIIQQYFLNAVIPPQNYIDYDELKKNREQLAEMEALQPKENSAESRENARREKEDYKRFFSIGNKHLVFYSEKSGFWKYYKNIIGAIFRMTNMKIHYVTNDPNDQVFEIAREEPRILPYYIGPKRIITLMMKMDADIVVMTTPDLDTFHIKRSYIRKDIEYIYTPHDAMSIHMGFREGAMDHFDTVLCVGPQQIEEIRATEKVYQLEAKNLVDCGYCLLDDMRSAYEQREAKMSNTKRILIAPSWQEDNLLDSCVDKLIEELMGDGREVVVRPHPEYVKRYPAKMESLINRWKHKENQGLTFETDFTSSQSIWDADILITDWSGVAYEYSYTTLKPSLFVNTQIKMMNPNWEKIGITPLEISLRDKIGVSLNKDELDRVNTVATQMLDNPDSWREQIAAVREANIFHHGKCGVKAAKYIISRLVKK